MIGVCWNSHITGTKKCIICGEMREHFTPGSGAVKLKKHERPRDKNGLNALDQLRRETISPTGVGTIRAV